MNTFLAGLDRDIQENLKQQLWVMWTHTSTAIEGNTLTLGETDWVIREGLTVSGKPIKDYIEVKNHYDAIKVLYSFLDDPALTEDHLFNLHKVVLHEKIMDIYRPVGAWKNDPNGTYKIENGQSVWVEYPAPGKIPALMKQWLALYNSTPVPQSKDEAVSVYSSLHVTFVKIHPFADGNGRMARLLANMPIIKAGLPPITIDSMLRSEYIHTLEGYELLSDSELKLNRDLKEFEEFTEQCWEKVSEMVKSAQDLQQQRNLKNGMTM